MKTIADRLRFARTHRGWTQSRLAAAAGVSQGTIGNIESGARQAKGSLPQIAEALGLNHKWLAQGSGSPWSANEPVGARPEDTILIALVQWRVSPGSARVRLAAAQPSGAPVALSRAWLARQGHDPEDLCAVRIDSDDLAPQLRASDVVVVDRGQRRPRDGGVFAVAGEDGVLWRRFRQRDGAWWMEYACATVPDQGARLVAWVPEQPLLGLVIHRQSVII